MVARKNFVRFWGVMGWLLGTVWACLLVCVVAIPSAKKAGAPACWICMEGKEESSIKACVELAMSHRVDNALAVGMCEAIVSQSCQAAGYCPQSREEALAMEDQDMGHHDHHRSSLDLHEDL